MELVKREAVDGVGNCYRASEVYRVSQVQLQFDRFCLCLFRSDQIGRQSKVVLVLRAGI